MRVWLHRTTREGVATPDYVAVTCVWFRLLHTNLSFLTTLHLSLLSTTHLTSLHSHLTSPPCTHTSPLLPALTPSPPPCTHTLTSSLHSHLISPPCTHPHLLPALTPHLSSLHSPSPPPCTHTSSLLPALTLTSSLHSHLTSPPCTHPHLLPALTLTSSLHSPSPPPCTHTSPLLPVLTPHILPALTWGIELHQNVLCGVLHNAIKVFSSQIHHCACCFLHTTPSA